MSITLEYEEARGHPASPHCLINISRSEDFFKATEGVINYGPSTDGDAAQATVAIIWLEKMFRMAGVEDPSSLAAIPFITRCLHLDDYLAPAVDLLCNNELIEYDSEGDVIPFETPTHLQERADAIVKELQDHPTLLVKDSSFDDYEPLTAATNDFKWLEKLSMETPTKDSRSLTSYIELSLVCGPHAVDARRNDPDGQLCNAVGGPSGGDLMTKMCAYFDMGPGTAPVYAGKRLPDFFKETQWQYPLDLSYHSTEAYAHDLGGRIKWQSATREQWPSIVQTRVHRAVLRMPTMAELLKDSYGQLNRLTQELVALGDDMLKGDKAQRLAFLHLAEMEDTLREEYADLIRFRRAAGDNTTKILKKLSTMMATEKEHDEKDATTHGGDDVLHGLSPVKRGPVKQAMAEASFVKLEVAWHDKLKGTTSSKETLELLDECLTAATVLTTAVIIASPGVNLNAMYSTSDFLNALKDKRDSLELYFGQQFACDEASEQVPDGLETFEWASSELLLLRQLRWGQLDMINFVVLKIHSKESTAQYDEHIVTQLYRNTHGITLVRKEYRKLFRSMGYARKVPESVGVTYEGYMVLIVKLHSSTVSMDSASAEGTHAQVEDYMARGFTTAARQFARNVYGAEPAGKSLGSWIEADQPVLVELKASVAAISKVNELVRALPGRFGGRQRAAALPGFETVVNVESGAGGSSSGGGGDQGKGRGKGNGARQPDGRQPGDGKQTADLRSKLEESKEEREKKEAAGEGKPGTGKLNLLSHEQRIKLNPNNVYEYDDGKFSVGKAIFDWPGIAEKYGLDKNLCGPVQCNTATSKCRDFNCRNPKHSYAVRGSNHVPLPNPAAWEGRGAWLRVSDCDPRECRPKGFGRVRGSK